MIYWRNQGELQIVEAPVDADLEIAEIHRRVIAEGGSALLFTNVKGAKFPCVTNLFGTARRVEMAFGSRPEQLLKSVIDLVQEGMPPKLTTLWKQRHLLYAGLSIGLKKVKHAPVLECVQHSPKLTELPALKLWSEDGGHFLTLPLVYTESPTTGEHNLGMYRMQVYDHCTTGIHWQIQKGGGFHYHESGESALPMCVSLGGAPALILAAIAPLPENIPELILASLIQGQKLKIAKYPDVPLPLLADAEFCIYGTVPPHETRPEGPFGDHYGYYSLQHAYPVFHVKKIFHRKNAIYPATVVGKPVQEDFFLGNYLQTLLSPLSKLVMPSVREIWSYGEAGYHSLSAIIVKERYARESMMAAFRILGESGGQLGLTKFLVVLNEAIDLQNFKQMLEHVLKRTRFESDFFVLSHVAMDSLDYTGPKVNHGSKAILLGIGEPIRVLQESLPERLPIESKAVAMYCPGVLVVQASPYSEHKNYAQQLANDPIIKDWSIVILTDNIAVTQDDRIFIWSTFTRFEPAADIYAATQSIVRNQVCLSSPLIFDCRMKPWYPKEVEVDESTCNLVDQRWHEYFPFII